MLAGAVPDAHEPTAIRRCTERSRSRTRSRSSAPARCPHLSHWTSRARHLGCHRTRRSRDPPAPTRCLTDTVA